LVNYNNKLTSFRWSLIVPARLTSATKAVRTRGRFSDTMG